jgi:transcriptional regulator with XRE-family HTH domain
MERAPRSLKVHPAQLDRVKAAYGRSDCFNQQDLADELGISLDTLSKFLNGKPVARANANEICRRLSQDSDEVLILGNTEVATLEANPAEAVELGLETAPTGELARRPEMPDIIDADCEPVGAGAEGTAAEQDGSTRIRQTADEVEGILAGDVNQVNTHRAAPATSPPAAAPAAKKDIEQTVRVIRPSGIVIGSADQMNIGPQE